MSRKSENSDRFSGSFSNKLGISVDFIVLGVGKQNPILFFCLAHFDQLILSLTGLIRQSAIESVG